MGLHIDWEHHEGYGAVRLSGAPSLGQFFSCIELLSVEAASWSHGCLLVDFAGITTLHSSSDQVAIGKEMARRLAHMRKMALVVPEEQGSPDSERPARKRGAKLIAFTSEEEAVRWLRGNAGGVGG